MTPFLLTLYVLLWPAVVAGVLFYLVRAFFSEWRDAREKNRAMI